MSSNITFSPLPCTLANQTVPPKGRFDVRIVSVAGETISDTLPNGILYIEDARIFLSDGAEIDGAKIIVHNDIADDVRPHLQFCELDLEGELVIHDDGYCLVSYEAPVRRWAA